jgi:hypothetical protein
MCELNPAHTLIFRLEVFTSDSSLSNEAFIQMVMERLLKAEQDLNADGAIRVHIHEAE